MSNQTVADKIDLITRRAELEERESQLQADKDVMKRNEEMFSAQKYFINNSRLANANDYARWLWGYLNNDGDISHFYDRNIPTKGVIILTQDSKITPLYGSSSKMIIVPQGIACDIIDLGHNTVYRCDDYTLVGAFVPLYGDVELIVRNM